MNESSLDQTKHDFTQIWDVTKTPPPLASLCVTSLTNDPLAVSTYYILLF